jgi:hypothetical protein
MCSVQLCADVRCSALTAAFLLLQSAIQLASYQSDPQRDAIAPNGVETVLHAALGDDSFCDFLQEQAALAGVDMRKISLPPPEQEGEPAPGTGVCMVLSGWVDSQMSKSDRCFVTHYGVVVRVSHCLP